MAIFTEYKDYDGIGLSELIKKKEIKPNHTPFGFPFADCPVFFRERVVGFVWRCIRVPEELTKLGRDHGVIVLHQRHGAPVAGADPGKAVGPVGVPRAIPAGALLGAAVDLVEIAEDTPGLGAHVRCPTEDLLLVRGHRAQALVVEPGDSLPLLIRDLEARFAALVPEDAVEVEQRRALLTPDPGLGR